MYLKIHLYFENMMIDHSDSTILWKMVDFTGKIHTSGIYLACHNKYNIINMQSVQVLDQLDKLDFYNASSLTHIQRIDMSLPSDTLF